MNRGIKGVMMVILSSALFCLSVYQAASQTFNQIHFVIGTGNYDVRGDSFVTATLQAPNGANLQTIWLKSQNQSAWSNHSTHMVTFGLNPPLRPSAIGHIVITLELHNGFGETDDNWDVQSVGVTLSNNGIGPSELIRGSGQPLQKLTRSLPSLVLDNPNCGINLLGPQDRAGRLKGFVDLHTHPLANLGFGGKVFYGGVDVGSLLPADPECNHRVRAQCMQQALGHDASTHGGPWVNVNPTGGGKLGLQNGCGDFIRAQVIHQVQTGNQAKDESEDARGAPDFNEWPVWNDITHQKMWVDWIRRAYEGGLRVMVALAVNNKTLGDMTAGPGDFPTDDKSSADLQLAELKTFVSRHADFMAIAASSGDCERIVRANKLAVVPGVEINNIGNLNLVSPLTEAEISAEISRLFNEGVRYIFPIHLLDNSFGGTAAYQDLMNYSNFRESGHWWDLRCAPSFNYRFASQNGFKLDVVMLAKLGTVFSPPPYPACAPNTGQVNARGLTAQGQFALKEMMRHGMLIDIDHMSELSQRTAITIAQSVGTGYPLNSGHNGLRILGGGGEVNERSMSTDHYKAIAQLHGMAGIGSAGINAHQWVVMCQEVINVMGRNAVVAFGTDTDGLAAGMPPARTPRSAMMTPSREVVLVTRWWDYNRDGVAHYGMLPDFLQDARTAPGGVEVVDDNLMYGATISFRLGRSVKQKKPASINRGISA